MTPRPCTAAAALGVIGEKWSLLVVRELAFGVHRFDSIVQNTGAPRDILTNRLRSLESAGVVEKRQYSERPPRFEYHLTQAGRELRPILLSLGQWGSRRAACELRAHVRLDAGARAHVQGVWRSRHRWPRRETGTALAGLDAGGIDRAPGARYRDQIDPPP
jgi:DNA-binding HxlR family transcriptional regulator